MTAEDKKLAEEILKPYSFGNYESGSTVMFGNALRAMEAYHQAKNTEITEADIGKWVRETELEDVSSSRGDILTFWEAFKNGEIKHINK